MGHNKWFVGCLGCLTACAGGCFAKWLIEEDKYQRTEYEKSSEKRA